jgi:hypothetical protein
MSTGLEDEADMMVLQYRGENNYYNIHNLLTLSNLQMDIITCGILMKER